MTLFQNIDEFIQFVKVSPNLSINTLEPYIEEAEIGFMDELMGELYTELKTDYTAHHDDTTAMRPDLAALLPYVQRPLAYHAMYLGNFQLSVKVGNVGVTHERNEKSDPAPKWKMDKLEFHYLQNGDRFAEKLLAYLEKNASDDQYATWYTSDKNTSHQGLIVRSAAVAMQYVDIEEAARRIFLKMKKRIRTIEAETIKGLIGANQHAALTLQIKNQDVAPNNQALLPYLEPIISKMALYQTIPSLSIHITSNGLTIYSANDGNITSDAASPQEIKGQMTELRCGEFGYEKDVERAKKYIYANIDAYPLIKASGAYTSKADPDPKRIYRNDHDNRHFVV